MMCIPVCRNNSLLAVTAEEGCASGEGALNAPRQLVADRPAARLSIC